MSRAPLVIGGIVVLGAAVALVLILSGSEESTASNTPVATAPPASDKPRVVPPPQGTSVTVTDSPPRLPDDTTAAPKVREYAVGDTTVRDHREGDHAPLDLPPNTPPADSRMIPSSLTHATGQKLKAVMMECAEAAGREGRGDKPRLEGVLTVAIKNKVLTVNKAEMQVRRIEGAPGESIKSCVEQKAIGLAVPADDQVDLDTYSINITFAIP